MRRICLMSALFTLLAVGCFTHIAAAQSGITVTEQAMLPKLDQSRPGVFHCDTAPSLFVGSTLSKQGTDAITPLLQRWKARFGSDPAPARPASKLPQSPFLLIGLLQDHAALRQLVASHKTELPGHQLGPEGYVLDITPERVLVAASRPVGAFYGVLKLLELDKAGDKGVTLPAVSIVDWPTMAWRGIHLSIGSRDDLPRFETLLTDVMPRFRLNQLILEVDYHFQFKSHPEVAEGDALTVEDCQSLKKLADSHFVRLIPMINCLGHQSWAAHTDKLLTAHPEFDETPDVPADNKGIYCRSWCPSNPEVGKVVNDLIDELLNAFDATAFHVGMDEVFLLGKCPRCKGQDTAHLFAKAVNDLHAHIVGKRKKTMLMWGDRLLDGKATGYGEWEASKNGTDRAMDLIPKDIVMCDWHYETHYNGVPATYPSVRSFQEKGFRVWPSSWNSTENARLLGNCSLENHGPKMVGYLATTWIGIGGLMDGLTQLDAAPTMPTDSIDGKRRRGGLGVASALQTGSRIAWEGKREEKGEEKTQAKARTETRTP